MTDSVVPDGVADADDDLMNLIGDTLKHKDSNNPVERAESESPTVVVGPTPSQPSPTLPPATPINQSSCDIAHGESPFIASTPLPLPPPMDVESDAASTTRDGVGVESIPGTSIEEAPSVVEDVESSPPERDSSSLRSRITALDEELSAEKSLRLRSEAESATLRAELSTAVSERDAGVAQVRQLKEDHARFAANGKAHYEKRLQDMGAQLNQVAAQAKERDQMARNAVEKLKQESSQKIADLQKRLEATTKEKDSMVVRYAEGETKVIKAENEKEKLAKSLADLTKDKDVLLGKVKSMRDEKIKMQQQVDAKQVEMANAQKELDRATENLRQSEQKARWLQGKMASETEGTGELKQKVDRLTAALKDAKEEAESSKKHYETVIREYQKKEEDQETDVTSRQREKEVKRIIDEQLIQDKEKTESNLKGELETERKKSAELLSETNSLKTRYKMIEEEKLELVSQLNDLHQQLIGKTKTIAQLTDDSKAVRARAEEAENLAKRREEEVTAADRRVADLENSIRSMNEAYEESHVEVDNYSARNAELLSFTEKVSSKNSQLLSEASGLKSQLSAVEKEKEDLLKSKTEADEKAVLLKTHLDALQTRFDRVKEEFETDVTAKTEMVTQLQQQLEDEKNEIKVMKKKHAMAIKELCREIQGSAAKKFFEGGHGSGASSDTAATLNSGSRAGSMNSLDNVVPGSDPASSRGPRNPSQKSQPDQNYYHVNGHTQSAVSVDGYHGDPQRMPDQAIVGGYNSYPEIAVVDIDKQKLVEKIVKLQKAHARKNEKMELMEEQIKALLVDIGKKDRVIQHYALREETGSISSEKSDYIKMELSKKGGSAMGSVFSAHHDGTMTLDLSLEINRKLQALFEDTLLKNMTLKENLETLGEEIANLSRSNRELGMELQIYKKISGNGS